ncbi:P1 family peptidase [Paucibacter sp. APW11]|uniref:P1 family peptidase n=1 Tax=Roseateles aquae TaxID=3077235 RepID=A0ABU3P8S0_9BURK|nr:P1 family peptidase [Paucibacter sp. APW11]MDT8998141.1 P1 family peptidase [Paucibacter sp. APW11]
MSTSTATPAPALLGSVCDVAGLKLGHHTDPRRPTGCSVVLCEAGAVAGVDVRGAAPGTRETDLLRPENTVDRVHAICLSGGSAFGLDAASGVMRWLLERGHGLSVGPACVPIVPAAVLFDLWVGDPSITPDAQAGYAACEAASASCQLQGSVGAGAGATVGKLFGTARAMKGGIGMASIRLHGITVAALVAVNAVGDVLAPVTGLVLAGSRDANGRPRSAAAALLAGERPASLLRGSATTIGLVATDAPLNKPAATKLAQMSHDGLARCINPIHTPSDGDVMFALATGHAKQAADLTWLGTLAAEVTTRAVLQAIYSATPWTQAGLPAIPSWRQLQRTV